MEKGRIIGVKEVLMECFKKPVPFQTREEWKEPISRPVDPEVIRRIAKHNEETAIEYYKRGEWHYNSHLGKLR